MLTAHVAEIRLFALGHMLLLNVEGCALVGLPIHSILVYVFFSAIPYTAPGWVL